MDLIFLGTGAGVPSKKRNVSSVALSLVQEINSVWLFDCGEATQHQIMRTAIRPRKIDKIFITHMHGDHIYGLPGLLGSRSFQSGEGLLTVYGPAGIEDFLNVTLRTSGTHLKYPLKIVEIQEGKLFEEDGFSVYAKKLDHGMPCYGYRIEEKDKPGELLVEKLRLAGISPGPIYREIKENEFVKTENGSTLWRKDFIGPDKKGRTVSILGDTRYSDTHVSFVEGSDLLVHEATFMHDMDRQASDYFHSTSAQAATLAASASVNKLVLTHISSRYSEEDEPLILAEAKEIFPATVLAHDFFQISIDDLK